MATISGIGGNHLNPRRAPQHRPHRADGEQRHLRHDRRAGGADHAIDVRTTTTPHGNLEPPFDVASLVAAAGASFVARWTTYHVFDLVKSIKTQRSRTTGSRSSR